MEDLFWTELAIKDSEEEYHIIFQEEMYWFIPKNDSLPWYSFKREHDEWHAANAPSEQVKDEAIDALEKYLMRQH